MHLVCRKGYVCSRFRLSRSCGIPSTGRSIKGMVRKVIYIGARRVGLMRGCLGVDKGTRFGVLCVATSLSPRPTILRKGLPFRRVMCMRRPKRRRCFLGGLEARFDMSVIRSEGLDLRLLARLRVKEARVVDRRIARSIRDRRTICGGVGGFHLLKLSSAGGSACEVGRRVALPKAGRDVDRVLLSRIGNEGLRLHPKASRIAIEKRLRIFYLCLSRRLGTS